MENIFLKKLTSTQGPRDYFLNFTKTLKWNVFKHVRHFKLGNPSVRFFYENNENNHL